MSDQSKTSSSTLDALEAYSNRLDEADKQVVDFVKKIIDETTWTYRVTVYTYISSYIIFSLILISGLILLVFQQNKNNQNLIALTWACILGGLFALIFLSVRNPIKQVRHLISDLVKLNVVYSGYLRQTHQVDTVFKFIFRDSKKIDNAELQSMLSYLQDIVAEAMNGVSTVINQADD
jgi:FtsH-binding integral membrane protein